MIVETKVQTRVWCEASCETTLASGNVAAVIVDGVTVLFDNPDDRCMAAFFIGGTKKANKAVGLAWQKFREETRANVSTPTRARNAFVQCLRTKYGYFLDTYQRDDR